MIAILFVTMFAAMAIGIPVGFSIVLSAFLALSYDGGTSLAIIIQRIVNGGATFTMLALPLFVFAGNLMLYGSTPRLISFANMLVRRLPGGMGIIGIVGAAFFGAVSGSGVATVAAIGSVVEPEMIKQQYGKGFTASVIAASGTLGVMIPPSIMAVVYATCAGTSVGEQLFAGIGPGIMVMLCLIAITVTISIKRGYGRNVNVENMTVKQRIRVTIEAIPPFMMPVIILGGIMSGVITPTESAVIAVVYALLLSVFGYRELKFKELMQVTLDSAITSSVILFIISAAAPFAWILTIKNIASQVSEFLFAISSSEFVIVALILLLILIMGTFMESTSIMILMLPILLPVMTQMGYDPVHFGSILVLSTTVGAVTPPLAVCLYTACSIIKVKIEDTMPDVFWIIGALTVSLIIVTIFPAITTWIPGILF